MKYILISLFIITSLFVKAQPTKIRYSEINIGLCSGVIPAFPGASSLVGVTNRYPSGIILDYQGGIAFPTLVTGKIGVGTAIGHNTDLTVGIRAFPSSAYIQLLAKRPEKEADLVFTAEALAWSPILGQYSIFTIGWRFNNMTLKQVRKK